MHKYLILLSLLFSTFNYASDSTALTLKEFDDEVRQSVSQLSKYANASLEATVNLEETDKSNQEVIFKQQAILMISSCSYIKEMDRLAKYMSEHQSIVDSSKKYVEFQKFLSVPFQQQMSGYPEETLYKEEVCADSEQWAELAK